MTQEQLAQASGMQRFAIASIEAGARGIRLGEAVTLCKAIDVDLLTMVGEAPMTLPVPAMTID